MRGKLLLAIGFAAGYVLGARAGRQRYEDIKRIAGRAWNDPRVQQQVQRTEDFAKDKVPDVVEFLSDGAKKVASQVSNSSRSKTSTGKSSSTKSSTGKASTSKTPASGSSTKSSSSD